MGKPSKAGLNLKAAAKQAREELSWSRAAENIAAAASKANLGVTGKPARQRPATAEQKAAKLQRRLQQRLAQEQQRNHLVQPPAAGSNPHSSCAAAVTAPAAAQPAAAVECNEQLCQDDDDVWEQVGYTEEDERLAAVFREAKKQHRAKARQEPQQGDGLTPQQALRLLQARLVSSRVPAQGQQLCEANGCGEPAVSCCSSCTPVTRTYWCASHDASAHSFAHFHQRQQFSGGFLQPLRPTQFYSAADDSFVDEPRHFDIQPQEPCACGSADCTWELLPAADWKVLIIYTSSGRFDFKRAAYACTSCRCTRVQGWQELLLVDMWPASLGTRNQTFVHVDVLRHWRLSQRHHPGASRKGEAAILNGMGSQHNQDKQVDSEILGKAYKAWRWIEHQLERCARTYHDTCPICSIRQHTVHIDGNMKLSVKVMRQCNVLPTYTDGALFIDDRDMAKVAALLDQARPGMRRGTVKDKLCGRSSWEAAGDQAGKHAGMIVSGRFLATCDHMLVLRAVNMMAARGGERYEYVYVMIAALLSRNPISFIFGDVMCKWGPWLEQVVPLVEAHVQGDAAARAGIPDALLLTSQQLATFQRATSAVHSRAHVWYCQLLFDAMYKHGAGLENGETTELCNSYASRLALPGRAMSVGASTDVLTEQFTDWNASKVEGMPAYVLSRYEKACSWAAEYEEAFAKVRAELEQLWQQLVTSEVIRGIGAEVVQAAKAQLQRERTRLTEKVRFFQLTTLLRDLRLLADYVNSGNALDRVLAGDDLASVDGLVRSLIAKAPGIQRRLEGVKESLQPIEAGAAQQPELYALGCDLVNEMQEVLQQLGSVQQGSAATQLTADGMRKVAAHLADLHSKLHSFALAAGDRAQQQQWRKDLADHMLTELQWELEALYLAHDKWIRVSREEDVSAKDRKATRKHIREQRAKVDAAVGRYNAIREAGSRPHDAITSDQICDGDFAWTFEGIAGDDVQRAFKDKLRLWQAYNRSLRAAEQVLKVEEDARLLVQYYETALKEAAAAASSVEGGVLEEDVLCWLQDTEEAMPPADPACAMAAWSIRYAHQLDMHVPLQEEADCGVFVMLMARYLVFGKPFDFTAEHMPKARKALLWEVYKQQLLPNL